MTQTFEKKSSRQYYKLQTNMFSKIHVMVLSKIFWPDLFKIYVVVVSWVLIMPPTWKKNDEVNVC